jgi:hypothetical protein
VPFARAFCAPETANSANPPASKIRIGIRQRVAGECQKKISTPAAIAAAK